MFRPTRTKLTVAALAAAGLALSGCGRKSGLDLPPSAGAAAPEAQAQPLADDAEARGRAVFGSPDARPDLPPARGGQKAFVLDPLLD